MVQEPMTLGEAVEQARKTQQPPDPAMEMPREAPGYRAADNASIVECLEGHTLKGAAHDERRGFIIVPFDNGYSLRFTEAQLLDPAETVDALKAIPTPELASRGATLYTLVAMMGRAAPVEPEQPPAEEPLPSGPAQPAGELPAEEIEGGLGAAASTPPWDLPGFKASRSEPAPEVAHQLAPEETE